MAFYSSCNSIAPLTKLIPTNIAPALTHLRQKYTAKQDAVVCCCSIEFALCYGLNMLTFMRINF